MTTNQKTITNFVAGACGFVSNNDARRDASSFEKKKEYRGIITYFRLETIFESIGILFKLIEFNCDFNTVVRYVDNGNMK